MKNYILSFLVLLGMIMADRTAAQCTSCTATTITVNLSANPDTVWTYTGTRNGSCCGIESGQRCIRFNVTVHPQATQIGFNVANPAPPGGAFYQVDCGPQTSLGTPLCITGLSTFCISFCKSGGDSPNYTISSSRTFSTSPNITLSQGCTGQIGVTGMLTSSIQWTSIAPGAVGQYNSYLSCTSGCSSPTVTPGSNPPAYVDYRVSGMVTGCSSGTVADTVRVTFVSGVGGTTSPTAPAVCFGSATTTVTAAGSGGVPPYSYEWKDSGGNTIGTLAAQPLSVGNYTVTIRDQLANCPGTTLPVTVIAHPSGITANAGPDQIRCIGSPAATLAGSVGVATGGTWTASGSGGTFTPNANTLNATFTPSASQLSSGSVTITLTTTGNGGCTPATDQMVIAYAANPIVSAGADQTICTTGTATLNGSVSGGASQGQWTTSGTGTFSPSATALNAIYTPSAADISAGSRTLTLTSTNGCTPVSSSMTLTIQPPPLVNAGSNASVCASSPSHTLNGSVTGGSITGLWSTSGSGTFSPNASTLNATYNPSAADINSGAVSLTLTSTGGCAAISSSKTLQIRPVTSVSAGSDRTICEGSTVTLSGTVAGTTTTGIWSSTGNGTFSPSATDLNAVYTPGSTDLSNGGSVITLTSTGAISCPNSTASFNLTIMPAPVVNAGASQTICAGSTATLNGSVTAGGNTGTWSGPGTFSPNENALNAVFTPNAAAVSAGTATLTLTSTNGCVVRTAQTTISITPQPVVNAGGDLIVCEGSPASLNGSVTVGGSAGIWSSSGSGTFSPSATTLNATYTPSANDISAGSITLILTSTDGCAVATDDLSLTITLSPIVSAGSDQLICQGSTVTMSGSVTAGGSTGQWSSSGTGTFSSSSDLTATYTPSSSDITSGNVTLTLASTNGCVVHDDHMILTIAPAPVVNAGADAEVCASNAVHDLNGSVTVGGSQGMWTTDGTGTFSPNASALNATYAASAADIADGSITLTLTATDGCSPIADSKVVLIRPTPVVSAGPDRTICEGQTVSLSGSVNGSTNTGQWSTSGSGSFSPSATALNATYTPSSADITAGNVTITLTATNSAPCAATSSSFVLTIDPAPIMNAGVPQTICANGSASLSGSVTVGGSAGIWSGPGTFSPNASTLNAVFTPDASAISTGNATLTLTSTDGCTVRTSQTTIMITPLPAVSAGSDLIVCEGSNATLAGSVTAGGSAGMWTTSGTGSFSPSPNTLNAVYVPSSADIAVGTVTLTLSSTDGCSDLSDELVLSITPAPMVVAGPDQTICEGTSATLNGSVSVGGSTGVWSTSGSGSFGSATALNTSYTPSSSDVAAGSVLLTLTSTNGCDVVADQIWLTITPLPVVNAGADGTVCAASATQELNGSVTVGGSTGIWSTNGSGTFSPNASALNAVYNATASDISAGSVILTLTSTDGCAVVTDTRTLTIQPQSLANAGADVVRCVNNSSVLLAGSVTGFSTTGTWTTAGTGSFSNATVLNATYSPSASDRANGSVVLTLTTTGNGVCAASTDQMTITFTPAPVVNAGADQTICANNAIAVLNGSVSAGASTGSWTSNGTGTFSSGTDLNATYTASAQDISSGNVTITLTSTNHGNCLAVNDQLMITFSPAPVVNAGNDVSVCINNPAASVSGTVSGGASTGTWTTAGDGSFVDANALSTTYNPGPNDLANGSVLVTLTSTNFGNCIAVSDSKLISFGNGPVVDAGSDITMCANNVVQLNGSVTGSTSTGQWSTSGSGTFDPSDTDLNAVYQPSAADTTAGSVTITLVSTNNGSCNVEDDQMTITFTPAPVVNAGADQAICANNAIAVLNGSVSAGASTGSWTSNGTGTFSSGTDLNATYTASAQDISSGNVTITLTSTNHGNCLAVNDQLMITFSPAPVVNAGNDVSVCINNPAASVSGTVSGGASTGTWTTAGDGSFVDANALSTTYNPGPNDLANGSVLVTLTSTNFGNCIAVSDSKLISFGNGPVVDAGSDITMCANNVVQLNGSVTGSTSTGQWSTSGSGTFDPSDTDLNAVYQPSAADTTAGSVTITLVSTNNGSCNVEDDQMTITFTPAPVVNAGADQTICANNAVTQLNGSVSAGATTGVWNSNGSGTFNGSTSDLSLNYMPSADDLANGSVNFTLTSTNNGNCIAESASIVVTYIEEPEVIVGQDEFVCLGENVPLHGIIINGSGTGEWTSSGSGIFDPSATALDATYIPSQADQDAGSVLLTLTSTNNGNCIAESDVMQINFTPPPSVIVAADQTVCDNVHAQLGGSISGSTVTGIWSTSGDGTFVPSVTAVNAEYLPGPTDAASGSVTLTLQATNACPMQDQLVLTVVDAPEADAGSDRYICTGTTSVQLSGAVGGGSTMGQWASLGDGNFEPSVNSLDAVYQLGSTDQLNGEVTLTLTTLENGVCVASTDTMHIFINGVAELDAGNDTIMCVNIPLALQGSISAITPVLWSTSGTGSFMPSPDVIDAEYIFSEEDATVGSVTITLSATEACIPTADHVEVTVIAQPIVDPGMDQQVCIGSPVEVTGSVISQAGTGIWSTLGTGSFITDPDQLTATYQPSMDDIAAGSVNLMLTSTGDVYCASMSSILTIEFIGDLSADAGTDQLICDGNTAELQAIVSGNASILWNSIGGGSFAPSADSADVTYTATQNELNGGSALIVLTVADSSGCGTMTDSLTITFSTTPIAVAGNSVTLCAGINTVQLNGTVSGSSITGSWTTSGDGTFFPDAMTLDATYLLGPNDMIDGAQLTLSSTGNGPCGAASDVMNISINDELTVDAGDDQLICNSSIVSLAGSSSSNQISWSSIGGGGFSPSDSAIDAQYQATAEELAAGSATLILSAEAMGCDMVTDTVVLTFNSTANVDAGSDQSICPGTPMVQLSGSVTGTSVTGVWSTNGDGTFSPDATQLDAQYLLGPNDQLNGVQLTLGSTNNGPCGAATDIVSIVIGEGANVDAGPDVSACVNTPGVTLSGLVEGTTSTGEWSTTGDGQFNDDAVEINAVYLPGPIDIANGSVWIHLTSTNNGDCVAVTDSLLITFEEMPIVTAGDDVVLCASEVLELNGTATAGSSMTWVTNGNGTIENADSLSTTYTPAASDGGQELNFVLLASNGCGIAMDTLVASILNAPSIDVDHVAECGSTVAEFTNNTTDASNYTWEFGDNASSNEGSPMHAYPSAGSYDVTLTAENDNGCSATTSFTVIIPETPIADFTASPDVVELYEYVNLASTSVGATTWQWNMGDGTTDVTGENVEHVFNETGTFTIMLTVTNDSGCSDTASVSVTVFEVPGPDPVIVLPVGIPTAFTPNGDNQNDIFFVRGGPFTEFDVRVYDNWGVQLFNSAEQNVGWDGSYNGKDQPSGVYVYTFKGRTVHGQEVEMAGDISIIR